MREAWVYSYSTSFQARWEGAGIRTVCSLSVEMLCVCEVFFLRFCHHKLANFCDFSITFPLVCLKDFGTAMNGIVLVPVIKTKSL